MDYYDAKDYAKTIGINSAVAATGLLLVVCVSIYRDVPAAYIWLGCALAGVVVYNLVHMAALVDKTTVKREAPVEVEAGEAEYVEASAPHVEQQALPPLADVDWRGLLDYVRGTPDASFSRSALAQWVPQRAYSPIDGSMSFPLFMTRIGAAYSVVNGGGLPTYNWSSRAVPMLERIMQVVGEHSPTPLTA